VRVEEYGRRKADIFIRLHNKMAAATL
jgi:hypothetical protein